MPAPSPRFYVPLSLLLSLPLSLLLSLSMACSDGLNPDEERRELLFTFDSGTEDWLGSFTDLAPGQLNDVGFRFEQRALPPEAGLPGGGLFVSGRNVSDDLFMFMAHPVTGLRPNTSYALTFTLELVSNAPSGCVGVGGAPGEGVYLKVGAAVQQPERVAVSSARLGLNVDKGEQSTGGANAMLVGNLANGDTDCATPRYRPIRRDNLASPFRLSADSQGALWLLVGTDSGFESTTALYYDSIRVNLEPAPN